MSDQASEGVGPEDVELATRRADEEFEQAQEEVQEQVDIITEQVNQALDEDAGSEG